jgi:hypothetical protein
MRIIILNFLLKHLFNATLKEDVLKWEKLTNSEKKMFIYESDLILKSG